MQLNRLEKLKKFYRNRYLLCICIFLIFIISVIIPISDNIYRCYVYKTLIKNSSEKILKQVPVNIRVLYNVQEDREILSVGYAKFSLPMKGKIEISMMKKCAVKLNSPKFTIGLLTPWNSIGSLSPNLNYYETMLKAFHTIPKAGIYEIWNMTSQEFNEYIFLLKLKSTTPDISRGVQSFQTKNVNGLILLGNDKTKIIRILFSSKNFKISQGIVFRYFGDLNEQYAHIIDFIASFTYLVEEVPNEKNLKEIIQLAINEYKDEQEKNKPSATNDTTDVKEGAEQSSN
jgi:hypothetical protein